jgi:hypothetical protein
MNVVRIARAAVPLLAEQGRLIRLPQDQSTVFVGDTHGDIDATERILDRYLANHVLVFLGDAVDRGPDSAGNLELILATKLARPTSVYLLMGNHEAWGVAPFSPADFWSGLGARDISDLSEALTHLPFAAYRAGGLLALHGALPELGTLDDFGEIVLGSIAWRDVTWGDFHEGRASEASIAGGRPSFDADVFSRRASRLGVRVVVRSHQPSAPTFLYNDRCVTIFSSSAYGDGTRRIAVLRPGTHVRSARDLILEEV